MLILFELEDNFIRYKRLCAINRLTVCYIRFYILKFRSLINGENVCTLRKVKLML